MRLASKLIIWFLIVAIIPGFFLGLTIYTNSRSKLLEDANLRLDRSASYAKAAIETIVEQDKAIFALVTSRNKLRATLAEYLTNGSVEKKALMQRIVDDALTSAPGHLLAITISDPQGKLIAASSGLSESIAEIRSSIDTRVEVQKKPTLFAIRLAKTGSVLAVRGLLVSQDQIVGQASILLSLKGISTITESFRNQLGKTWEILLVDRSNKEDVNFIVGPRLADYGSYSSVISEGTKIPLSYALNKEERLMLSPETLDYRGKQVLAATRYLKGLDWGIVVKVDREEALAQVTQIRKDAYFFGATMGVLALILTLIVVGKLIKPIRELISYTDKIRMGKLDTQISSSLINSPDEYGDMARSFVGLTKELIEANESLRVSNEKIEGKVKERTKELEELLYSVSHDLKAPLVTVQGFAELLHDHIEEGNLERAQDASERVKRASQRLATLIDDLLVLSSVERKMEDVDEVDMNSLFKEIAFNLSGPLEKAQAKLEIQGEFPKVAANKKGLVDVFENLVGNAIKYGSEKPNSTIRLGYQDNHDEHRFFVEDEGPGVPEQHKEKIFVLFQRLNTNKDGTGFGLAIVAKIMRKFGGQVWVENKPENTGAIFWTSLPKANGQVGKSLQNG